MAAEGQRREEGAQVAMSTVTEDSTATEGLLLTAGVDVRKIPTVSMVAYTGGLMTVPQWGLVVLDLGGLDVTGAVTILSDHDSHRRQRQYARRRNVWPSMHRTAYYSGKPSVVPRG